MSSLDYLDLCRLCLVKDRVSVPIFEGEGDVRQIFLKIAACLPVKVAREDKLPKKICDDCVYKVELFYQFWNTTANAEKQLLQWLGEVGLEDKQGYVTGVLNPSVMKQEQNSESRLDGNVMQQVSGHQDNMGGMTMIDNMGLGMPIMIPSGNQQQITSVPMDTSGNSVQTVRPVQQAVVAVAGPSAQPNHQEQLAQNQGSASATAGAGTNPTTATPTVVTASISHQDDEEDTTDEDENSDEECDADEGLPVKEESEEDPSNNRTIEPTTFVNVSLACDEAGPSGLQQQKITEMPEMSMPQAADGDPKSGYYVSKITMLPQECDGSEMSAKVFSDSTEIRLIPQNVVGGVGVAIGVGIVEESIFPCTICGEGFISKQAQDAHLKTQHEEKILAVEVETDCETEVTIGEEEEQQQQQEVSETIGGGGIATSGGAYACEHCGRSYTTPSVLRKHQLVHTGEKSHTCETCGYASVHRQNLLSHQRRHNFEYKFHCEICGTGFYAKSNYLEHQLMHSKEKPFQCEICSATFRYRQGLRLHAKLHQPDYVPPQKKHHCELCNKRFSRKQVLLVHMKTHGTSGSQNEFVCHICGKAVSSKTYLTVHVRKHTGEKPHVCDLCGKGFISQNYLSVHRRTHTGERPHKCTHCEKRFTQRTTLVVHLRGHTGDRPYPCTFCHKSFASKTMLNSHLKTHAKQNARAQQEQQQHHNHHHQQQQQQEQQQQQQQELHPQRHDTVTVLLPG